MRRLSVVLLLLVIATTGVVGVDAVTRRMVQQKLADRLPESPRRASAELANLASKQPEPFFDNGGALRQLAAAAVSGDKAVALAAQQEINAVLESNRPSSQRPQQRRRLAEALRASGPGSDPEWTASVARRLLQLVEQQDKATPAALTRGLLEDCEAVLAAASTAQRPTTKPAPDDPANAIRPRLALRSSAPTPDAAPPRPAEPSSPLLQPPPMKKKTTTLATTPTRRPTASATPPQAQEPRSFITPETTAATRRLNPASEDWGPTWGRPSPPKPIPAPLAFPTALPPAPEEDITLLSDRELLRRFLPIAQQAATAPAATGPAGRSFRREQQALEDTPQDTTADRLRQAVVDRGLGGVATRHVAMLLSEREPDRLRLVNLLQTTRSDGAARYLLMLARDPSPTVRREAIRTLASASDPQLVQAAWQLARDDQDPRVAHLVNELQTR